MLRFRFNVRVLTTVHYASIFGIAASGVLTSLISYELTRISECRRLPSGDNRTEVDALQVEAQAPQDRDRLLFDPAHHKRQRQVVDSSAKEVANACYLEKKSVRKRNCFIFTSSFLANPVKSLGQEKLNLRACYIT